MNRYEGGDLFVESLLNLGVGQIYSVSGGPLNSIYHAASRHGLPLVHTRHEAAAGFMADASARISGTPGVVAVTLGPGVTNMTTPALVAQMAGVPMLIVGAQAPVAAFDRGAAMSADHLPIMAPVTKWAARVHETHRIPEYVEAAWRHMWAGRPGPVFLELPVDVLAAPAEQAKPAAFVHSRPGLDAAGRAALEAELAAAKRPLLILGDELHWDRSDKLDAAVERLGAPFVTLRLARGIVSERHELWAGPGYLPCNKSLRQTIAESDLIVMLGHHFESDLAFGDVVPATARVVQVAADTASLGRNRRADVPIAAGAAATVEAMAAMTAPKLDHAWAAARIVAWRGERDSQAAEVDGTPLHPVAVVDAIVESAPDDTMLVTSHGNVDFWADARLRVAASDLYLRAGQAGALGAEVCFGVGAKFARPDRPAVVIVGDGGVGYHVPELDTAARYGRPVVIVVMDDQKWSAIALPQELDYGAEFEMGLPARDWVKVAEGLGGAGYRATTLAEVKAAVAEATASDKPAIVHVSVRSVLSPYMAALSK